MKGLFIKFLMLKYYLCARNGSGSRRSEDRGRRTTDGGLQSLKYKSSK